MSAGGGPVYPDPSGAAVSPPAYYQEHTGRWKRLLRRGGGFFLGFGGVAEAEVFGVRGLKSAGPGCVAGGAWIKAPARSARRRPAQRAAEPRRASLGSN